MPTGTQRDLLNAEDLGVTGRSFEYLSFLAGMLTMELICSREGAELHRSIYYPFIWGELPGELLGFMVEEVYAIRYSRKISVFTRCCSSKRGHYTLSIRICT